MWMPSPQADLAVIFAGGEASRMGGTDKGSLEVGGQPLWRRVSDRLRPQAMALAVVAPIRPGWLDRIDGAVWLPDASSIRIGPAGALAAGLRHLLATNGSYLLTAPIDAPFLPEDLLERMAWIDAPVVLAKSGGKTHPVFGRWAAQAAPAVLDAVAAGEHSLRRLAELAGCIDCEAWENSAPDPFFNVNTPADLAEAQRIAASS